MLRGLLVLPLLLVLAFAGAARSRANSGCPKSQGNLLNRLGPDEKLTEKADLAPLSWLTKAEKKTVSQPANQTATGLRAQHSDLTEKPAT